MTTVIIMINYSRPLSARAAFFECQDLYTSGIEVLAVKISLAATGLQFIVRMAELGIKI